MQSTNSGAIKFKKLYTEALVMRQLVSNSGGEGVLYMGVHRQLFKIWIHLQTLTAIKTRKAFSIQLLVEIESRTRNTLNTYP